MRMWIAVAVTATAIACGSDPEARRTADGGTGGANSQGGSTATGGTHAPTIPIDAGTLLPFPPNDPSCPDVVGATGFRLATLVSMNGCCLPAGVCGMGYWGAFGPTGCYPYYGSGLPIWLDSGLPTQFCGPHDGGIDAAADASADSSMMRHSGSADAADGAD